MRSKSELAIVLSRLEGFRSPNLRLEQYQTPSEIAADVLWSAFLQGDTHGKWADMACGPGILGIGALLMGVEDVYFVDMSAEALEICKNNIEKIKSEGYDIGECHFLHMDISEFSEKVDVVVENPPFGTKIEHADRQFLEKAFSLSTVIYTIHKTSTRKFVEAIAKDHGFEITHEWNQDFQLPATMEHHRKRISTIKTTCFRLFKKAL
jgi:putative methylase